MKKFTFLLLLIICMIIIPPAWADGQDPQVIMQTSLGTITLTLNSGKAPKTVANFLAYVENGFYDDTIFHRVIKGFMIQGGGFTGEMQRKSTNPPINNEADNGLPNQVGTIAMARTSYPHSATSQFFINTADNAPLNHRAKSPDGWGYCVFGRVTEGMDVVRAIEQVQTGMRAGHRDVPVKPVVITSVRLAASKPAEATKN